MATPDPTRRALLNARQRCTNPNNPNWDRYGGRGITMCERWMSSYEAFLDDMGTCPPGLTLDRIDNDGNYEPGNCRWATRKEQANNLHAGGFALENRLKTHCKHGHELTGDNVHIPPGRPDRRYCRQCEHIYWKQRWANRDKTNDHAAHRDS